MPLFSPLNEEFIKKTGIEQEQLELKTIAGMSNFQAQPNPKNVGFVCLRDTASDILKGTSGQTRTKGRSAYANPNQLAHLVNTFLK